MHFVYALLYFLDRANFSSYVAMEKNGSVYVNPDGKPSNKAAVASDTSNAETVPCLKMEA